MNRSALFSSGFELATFVKSSVLLRKSWDVTASRYAGIITNVGEGLSWKVYKEPDSGLTIVAFEVKQDSSNFQVDLVSSYALREKNFHHFDFLCTEKAPDFSVNSTAISLFYVNYEKLHQLKSEINSSLRLIVTGHALGGPIASLFTLFLLDNIGSGNKPPLCITFGSPLIGDKKLQESISRSSTWSSCFLHVVSNKDPLLTKLNPHTSAYMPFGTFLFCSDTNFTCFENPESVLELLIGSIHDQNQGYQPIDYGKIVENLYRKAICKDFTPRGQDLTHSNSLRASICLQLWAALELTPDIQQQHQQNIHINGLATKLEELEIKFIFQKKRAKFDPSRKLNSIKQNMARLEWYRKDCQNRGIGYYDSYKKCNRWSDEDAVLYYRNLTSYWKEMVKEVKLKPQKRNAAFRKSWIYAGTSYRRMVEPLVIAEYYRQGRKEYVKERSEHFVLLEEWFSNEKTKASTSNEEDIRDLDHYWNWDSWRSVIDNLIRSNQGSNYDQNCDSYTSVVDNHIRSSQGSTVVQESEDNSMLNTTSDAGNDKAISSTMGFSWSSTNNQLLLSSKMLNTIEENEENLNTTSKNNDKNNSCFEACVNVLFRSSQGSDKEENRLKELEEHLKRIRKKNVETLLTNDSCFWAHVEEARISCKELEVIEEKQKTLKKLDEFEEYVYGLLENYEVSPDIFLRESSYMGWWNEYKAIKGTSYDSKLANFMNHVENHKRYALGDYDFP